MGRNLPSVLLWLLGDMLWGLVLRSGGPKVSFRFNVEPNKKMNTS
jgi:hypothetical protein